jgi:hypothetical protein
MAFQSESVYKKTVMFESFDNELDNFDEMGSGMILAAANCDHSETRLFEQPWR